MPICDKPEVDIKDNDVVVCLVDAVANPDSPHLARHSPSNGSRSGIPTTLGRWLSGPVMNSHAAKAAAAERTSVSARREPGARTIVSASLSGMSAPSGLADSPFGHEFGHSLGCRQVVSSGRDICFADSDHRGVVTEQFDRGFEGLEVLGLE